MSVCLSFGIKHLDDHQKIRKFFIKLWTDGWTLDLSVTSRNKDTVYSLYSFSHIHLNDKNMKYIYLNLLECNSSWNKSTFNLYENAFCALWFGVFWCWWWLMNITDRLNESPVWVIKISAETLILYAVLWISYNGLWAFLIIQKQKITRGC